MKKANTSDLNKKRLRLMRKGYMTVCDIEKFVPCGYKRAKDVYDICVQMTEKDGKLVGMFGINPVRVLNYLGITEKDIRKYAEDEEAEHNSEIL